MQEFIRRNLFLVAIAGGVVVAAAILLTLSTMVSGDVSELQQKRVDVSSAIRSLPRTSQQTLADQRKASQALQTEAEEAQGLFAEQQERYPVMTVDWQGQKVKAFPYMERTGMPGAISARYVELMTDPEEGVLTALDPVGPLVPTDPYLQARIRYWRKKLLEYDLKGAQYAGDLLRAERILLDHQLREIQAEYEKKLAEEVPQAGEGPSAPVPGPGGEMIPREYYEEYPPPGRGGTPARPAPTGPAPGTELIIERLRTVQATLDKLHTREIQNALAILQSMEEQLAKLPQVTNPVEREALLGSLLQTRKDYEQAETAVQRSDSELRNTIRSLFLPETVPSGAAPSTPRSAQPPRGRYYEEEYIPEDYYPRGGRRPSSARRPDAGTATPVEMIEPVSRAEHKEYARRFLARAVDLSDAVAQGWRDAMVARAGEGRIYAKIDALDLTFLTLDPNASAEQLWTAQVNYWVTRDIVAAIRGANAEALDPLPKDEQQVPQAPIKQLVSIQVAPTYYTGGTPPLLGRSATQGPATPAYSEFGYMEAYPEEGPPRGRMAVPAPTQAILGETLTGRVSTPEYDVAHYQFTAVLPLRYLRLLEKHLTAGQLHTILDVEMQAVTPGVEAATARSERGSPREAATAAAGLYYGTEPVMQVTIYGEFLLLTNWARDLTPIEALVLRLGRQSTALRSEDRQRLPTSPAMTGGR